MFWLRCLSKSINVVYYIRGNKREADASVYSMTGTKYQPVTSEFFNHVDRLTIQQNLSPLFLPALFNHTLFTALAMFYHVQKPVQKIQVQCQSCGQGSSLIPRLAINIIIAKPAPRLCCSMTYSVYAQMNPYSPRYIHVKTFPQKKICYTTFDLVSRYHLVIRHFPIFTILCQKP